MIFLKRGEVSVVAVTASELGHLAPSYTFKFMHQLNKRVVDVETVVVLTRPDRIDFFHIDVDAHFANEDDGEYTYEIFANYPYDQPSALIEVGIMQLAGAGSVPVQYEGSPKEYTTYGG